MSVDEEVAKDLIETLENGKEGFAKAAENLEGSATPEWSRTLRGFSQQRAEFSAELREIARSYGDEIDQSGTIAGALHRGWMSLRDALSGSSPYAVLDAAEQGEDHAVKEYGRALEADISPDFRAVVQRQFADVRAAHDQVRALRNAAGPGSE